MTKTFDTYGIKWVIVDNQCWCTVGKENIMVKKRDSGQMVVCHQDWFAELQSTDFQSAAVEALQICADRLKQMLGAFQVIK